MITKRNATRWRLLAGVLCAGWFCLGIDARSAESPAGGGSSGLPGVALRMDSTNFTDLAREAHVVAPVRKRSKPLPAREPWPHPAPPMDPTALTGLTQLASPTSAESAPEGGFSPASIPPSPAASASFEALADDGTRFNPDTQGAVGPNHIMTTLQNGVRIHDRFGVPISTVTLEAFWSSVGATAVYDPRVLFDPVAQRWIHTAAADPVGNNPGLLVAVSATSDPTGVWRRYFVATDAGEPLYADSPRVGFNKDWITVQANLYRQDTSAFSSAGIWALNKTNFYAGGQGRFTFFKYSTPGLAAVNALVPAVTYDAAYPTNFLVANWVGNFQEVGYLRLFSIGGSVGAEVFNDFPPNGFFINGAPSGNPPWSDYAPLDMNFAPQLGTSQRIHLGDARIQNAVFRNGALWCTHTIFLLNSGPARSAVQWWSISPGANVLQRGRVDDPGGVNFFAYPSLAVNSLNDVLVGYTRFSANQYPSANYSFHAATDGPGNLRADAVLKAGEGKWAVADSARVRWGDWSGTVVDPANDLDFWTIQEYGAAPGGSGDRWGTWWGRVAIPGNLGVSTTGSPASLSSWANVTYTIRATNNNALAASGAKIIDTLPAGAEFVSANSTRGVCGHTNGVVVCDFGSLPANGSATVTLVASLSMPGPTTNSVVVAANGPDTAPADNTARVTTTVNPAADLFPLIRAIPNPPLLNNNFTFEVTVTNRGLLTATAVTLTNILPVDVNFVSLAASQGSCNHNGSLITCALGDLNSMGAVNVSVMVTPVSSGFLTNRATVGTSAVDAVPGNNSTSFVTRPASPPTIGPISNRSLPEDSMLGPVTFTVSDLDTPAASLMMAGFSSNPAIVPAANVTFGGMGTDRTVFVTPAPDANGLVTIFCVVTDSDGASATNSFLLSITPANDRPLISDILNQTMNEDSVLGPLSFLVSDPEAPAASLVVSASSSNTALVPNGNIVLSAGVNRTLTITPAANQFGSTSITVTVSDGALTASDTFTMNVNAVNDLPTISDIPNRAINEDSTTGSLFLGVNDVETPAASLVLSSASSNPALVPTNNIVFGGIGPNRTVTVTPIQNQSGSAIITLTVTDGSGGSTNDVFSLTVNPVNDVPTLNLLTSFSILEDSGDTILGLAGIGAGGTGENQVLTITATSSNPALIPTPRVLYTNGSSTGVLIFAPATNASGLASITVSVNDGAASNNVVARGFNVTVLATNYPPVVTPISDQTINEDASTNPLPFIIGDVDTPSGNLSLSGQSSNTNLVPNTGFVFGGTGSNRTVVITPAANQSGTTTLQIIVSDGSATNVESLLLTVLPQNDPPAITPIPLQTTSEDASLQVNFSVTDPETNPNAMNYSAEASNSKLIPAGNMTFGGSGTNRFVRVLPATNQFGSAVIQITISDGTGASTNTSFVLNVSPVNDAPTLNLIGDVTLDENTPGYSLVLVGISVGAPNEPGMLTVSATSDNSGLIPHPSITHLSPSATALLQLAPAPGSNGVANVTVTLNDGEAANNLFTRTFRVTVNAVNDLPTISTITDQVIDEDGEVTIAFNLGDTETAAESLTLTVLSSNEELIDPGGLIRGGAGASRTLTLRPLSDQFGSATITVTVTDGEMGSASTVFDLRVRTQNDRPAVSNPPDLNLVPEAATPVPFTLNDQDTPPGDLHVTASSSNPALVPSANLQITGNESTRMLMIRSLPSQTGTAVITLTVDDGTLTNSSAFRVNVSADVLSPPLQIELAGTNVVVSWSTNSALQWNLQTNANVAGSSWNLAGIPPSLAGGRYQVTLPTVGQARFFRLCRNCGGTPPPALGIARTLSGIVVSWSAPPETFVLELGNALDPSGTWITAPETPGFANGTSSITVAATGTARFFRLRTR